jgi:hypothetical protein
MTICSCDFHRGETDSDDRPINTKVAESRVSVKDWAATGASTTADGPLVQDAIDNVEMDNTLYVPPGVYLQDEASFAQTRRFDWLFERGGVLIVEDPEESRHDALRINIAPVTDVVGEARNLRLRGGTIATLNTEAPPNPTQEERYAAGGYGVAVNSIPDFVPVLGLKIEDMVIGGGNAAILFDGPGDTDSVFFSGAEDCTLDNGVVLHNVSDGMRFVNNLSFGLNPAYTLEAREGSFNHLFEGGTTGNQRGALDVINGSMFRLFNVQIEHGAANSDPNDQTLGASVIVRGNAYPSIGGLIKGCNFGAGSNVTNSIVLLNAIGTVIDENYFNITNEEGADLVLGGDAKNSIIGTRNQFRGERSRQSIGTCTDASRLMVIGLGASVIEGARGIWQAGASVFTSVQNTWAFNGLEVMLTETGMVVFNGAMQSGSTTGTIFTIPAWLRPVIDARILVTGSDGLAHGLNIDASTGALSIIGTLTSTNINFANTTYAAVLNVPYDSGP